MKLLLVAGARPNFMKIAPLMHALQGHPRIRASWVHTGQHYDESLSARFCTELELPAPQYHLGVGSGSQAVQTARMMEAFERVCLQEQPQSVLVVGDVTSTLACALTAAKLGIRLLHYEAGLRSHDRSMPEEINRLATDAISDVYFTTCREATENLLREGVSAQKIYMTGNLMMDALVAQLPQIRTQAPPLLGPYGVATFHRPANVDHPVSLARLLQTLGAVSRRIPLLFPLHPRTRKQVQTFGLEGLLCAFPHLHVEPPLGYRAFMGAVRTARFVLTDSGGIQEETTYLHIPCLTVRPGTERPVTLTEGSNLLISVAEILPQVEAILAGRGKTGRRPLYWDGATAGRMVQVLERMA